MDLSDLLSAVVSEFNTGKAQPHFWLLGARDHIDCQVRVS
jgi:hypothetical protein